MVVEYSSLSATCMIKRATILSDHFGDALVGQLSVICICLVTNKRLSMRVSLIRRLMERTGYFLSRLPTVGASRDLLRTTRIEYSTIIMPRLLG